MEDYHINLFIKLAIIGKQIQALINRHNTDVLSQGVILMTLSHSPLPVSKLAEKFGLKMSAMSSRINTMEKQGLLNRITSGDRRSNVAEITENGRQALASFMSQMKARCNGKNLGITEHESKQLLTLLSAIKLEDI